MPHQENIAGVLMTMANQSPELALQTRLAALIQVNVKLLMTLKSSQLTGALIRLNTSARDFRFIATALFRMGNFSENVNADFVEIA